MIYSMNCNDFQKKINDFLNDSMEFDDIKPFIDHLENCKECFDELEINFLVKEGLNTIDDTNAGAYDFKGKLSKKIYSYKKLLYKAERHESYMKMMYIASEVVAIIMFIIFSIEYYI